jgi:ribokinase
VRVVVVGSINVDLVVVVEQLPAAGETVAGGRFAQHGGGKSANQAVAAARLGAAVSLVGAVGADAMGDEAVAALEAEGIDVSGVSRLDEPTGVALIVVDAAGENQIAVASGANAALAPAHVQAQLARLLAAGPSSAAAATPPAGPSSAAAAATPPAGSALAAAGPARSPGADAPAAASLGAAGTAPAHPADSPRGIVLLGHEVSPEVVSAAATAAAAAGWPIVLNPAPARELPDAQLAVLTPNASEAAQLTGEDEPEAAARALAEQTGAAVLITLGARGALLLEPGGEPQLLPATKVDVVDTTGAGDTVNGALAAELAAGRSLPEAARFALRAAALSTTAPGARGGMPRRGDV